MGEVDSRLPGLVRNVYVTGSVGLGDFQPEISDIDLVAVSSKGLGEWEFEVLEGVHHPSRRPQVDVLYITEDGLLGDPRRLSSPYSREGKFFREGAFAANPVTWRDLQTYALTVRGRPLEEDDVWFDPDALRSWSRENLEQYWQRQIQHWKDVVPTDFLIRHQYGLQWLVLGVPRLHYTIATLQITSKTGAGRYALEVVDRKWHPVIEAAIALRADRTAPLRLSIEEARSQAVDVAAWLIEDARKLSG